MLEKNFTSYIFQILLHFLLFLVILLSLSVFSVCFSISFIFFLSSCSIFTDFFSVFFHHSSIVGYISLITPILFPTFFTLGLRGVFWLFLKRVFSYSMSCINKWHVALTEQNTFRRALVKNFFENGTPESSSLEGRPENIAGFHQSGVNITLNNID